MPPTAPLTGPAGGPGPGRAIPGAPRPTGGARPQRRLERPQGPGRQVGGVNAPVQVDHGALAVEGGAGREPPEGARVFPIPSPTMALQRVSGGAEVGSVDEHVEVDARVRAR